MTQAYRHPTRYTDLDPDQSADILALEIETGNPFAFVRYGDGYIEAMLGKAGGTCDREAYTSVLAAALCDAWSRFAAAQNLYLGDWLASSFSGANDPSIYENDFKALVAWNRLERDGGLPKFLHPEALLMMRCSGSLASFYGAVRQSKQRKLLVAAEANYPAAKLLDAQFIGVPMKTDLMEYVTFLHDQITSVDYDMLLWGAGMAGTVAASLAFQEFPTRTYINLGSALDPAFRGKSRREQITKAEALRMLSAREPAAACT